MIRNCKALIISKHVRAGNEIRYQLQSFYTCFPVSHSSVVNHTHNTQTQASSSMQKHWWEFYTGEDFCTTAPIPCKKKKAQEGVEVS